MEAQSQATQTADEPESDTIETQIQLSQLESFTVPGEGDYLGPLEDAPSVDVVDHPEYALYLNAARTLRDRHDEIGIGTPTKIAAFTDDDMVDLQMHIRQSLSATGSHCNSLSPIDIPGFELAKVTASIVDDHDGDESDTVEMRYTVKYDRTA